MARTKTHKPGAAHVRRRFKKGRQRPARTLNQALERLYAEVDLAAVTPDPLELVLEYKDPKDREVAGFLASAWAYGRADLILAHAGEGLKRMGDSPSGFVDGVARGDMTDLQVFDGLVHRFHRGGDWAALCFFAGELRSRHGSLAGAFARWHERSKGDLRNALIEMHRVYHRRGYPDVIKKAGLKLRFGDQAHLLPDPAGGSACKRLNLYLRWMVRKDRVDPGPWRTLSPGGPQPRDLIVPLDTHMARLGRSLGLTRRATPGWSMAADITGSLARFDPDDPVKYDFALCRLGILEICPRSRDRNRCRPCPVHPWCKF